MDQIIKVDKLIKEIMKRLPEVKNVPEASRRLYYMTNPERTEILNVDKKEIDVLADFFDQLYEEGACQTGYYDPEEDAFNDEIDEYTGLYYLSIA